MIKSGIQAYPQAVVESGFLNHDGGNVEERKNERRGESGEEKEETKSEMKVAPSGAVTRKKARCAREVEEGGLMTFSDKNRNGVESK